jgi:hypothetical protein
MSRTKHSKTFKRSKAVGFFDEDLRLSKLSKLGIPAVYYKVF